MRFTRSSRSLALLLLAVADLSSANPLPRDDDLRAMGYQFLVARGCPTSQQCGYNKFCCGSGEVCTTVTGDKATCVAAAPCAGCATTWTETHTYTSTMATCWDTPPQPTVGVNCVPQASDQEACGPICCAGWQTCAYNGQCSAKPGIGEGTTIILTSNGVVTTQYSAPYRVTGTTTVVGTGARTTETPTTATSTATAIGASRTSDVVPGAGGTGGHLSPGAIAGIVIGTLAGISLLLLLCFCCIARGLWVALFGKKKKDEDRERIDVYEERYSRHGSRAPSAHSRRDRHKGWFAGRAGGGPSSAGDRRSEKKKSGGGKTWLGIAGLAATLLALLNLKKDKRPASTKPARSSRYSDSYYSYSDYTSPSGSSASSGGRTNRTRRTRDSRAKSYYSRSSRRP